MSYTIDIIVVALLLYFFWRGQRKGALLSVLGISRVAIACIAAYFSGRYIGFWLGGVLNRPRIVMVRSPPDLPMS